MERTSQAQYRVASFCAALESHPPQSDISDIFKTNKELSGLGTMLAPFDDLRLKPSRQAKGDPTNTDVQGIHRDVVEPWNG